MGLQKLLPCVGLQEPDLNKRSKIDYLKHSSNEWSRVGQFADLLSVGTLLLSPIPKIMYAIFLVRRRGSASILFRSRLDRASSSHPSHRNSPQVLILSRWEIENIVILNQH